MNKIIVIILFTVVSITWGTTWTAMKIVTETIPPLFATGMRFLIASPVLIILSYLTNSPLLFPSGQRFFQIIISIFYFSIPFSFMLYGSTYISSSISSMILANMPIAVLIISSLYLKKKIFWIQKLGILISTITLFYILLMQLKIDFIHQWKPLLALLLALFSHAMIYVICQKKSVNVSVLTFNALPSLLSGILLLIIAFYIENPNISNFSNKSIISILYLGDFSGIFGILSYFYLQKKVSSFYASTIFLIFPFISFFLEYYIYGNTINISEIWCIIPLIFGILLTLMPTKKLYNSFNLN